MKVIGFSGSPRRDGNTDRFVQRVLAGAESAGAETGFYRLDDMQIRGCRACMGCRRKPECSIDDDFSPLLPDIFAADALVLGSPVYMWQVTGQTKLFMDRLYPVINPDFSSRLKKHPKMVLVFAQGNPDPKSFDTYFQHTRNMFGFLGFTVTDVLVAAGTRGLSDIAGLSPVLEQALAAGKALCQ